MDYLVPFNDIIIPRESVLTTTTASYGQAVHQVHYLTQPVLDAYVTQQVHMVGFFLKTGDKTFATMALQQVPRSVKDAFRSF